MPKGIALSSIGMMLAALAVGCSDGNGSTGGTSTQTPPAAAKVTPTTFAEQVDLGKTEFGAHCASCHGDSGQGTSQGPRLVGLKDGALPLDPPPGAKVRKTKFVTVGDVAEFAVTNMPADKPGSLDAEVYLAILAFDLHANGLDLNEKLTVDKAKATTIPR
jgi:cytochrome c